MHFRIAHLSEEEGVAVLAVLLEVEEVIEIPVIVAHCFLNSVRNCEKA